MIDEKLRWRVEHQMEGMPIIYLEGRIVEDNALEKLSDQITGPVCFDMHDILRFNSIGTREWVGFIRRIVSFGKHRLRRCSPIVVQQINLVFNFLGSDMAARATVESVMGPYYCKNCDDQQLVEISTIGPEVNLPAIRCKICGGAMEFDDVESNYFYFLASGRQP